MAGNIEKDWNPETYGRFRGLRLRPAIDLLMRVGALPSGDIVDLGCGSGQVGPALKSRWPERKLIGVDTSPNMLEEAEAMGCYDTLCLSDATDWLPDAPAALIFSNALCHWLPDHDGLFTKLAKALVPGGTLAVQMPRQQLAPSHALMREVATELAPDAFDFSQWKPQVADPLHYVSFLSGLGRLDLWETEYQQQLGAVEQGHPVRHFTRSTAMRPFEAALKGDAFDRFLAEYDARLATAYPTGADGSAVLSFRRLFFVLVV